MSRTQLLTLAAYGGFFWFFFVLFAYWTFPYDRVAAYITDLVDEGHYGYTLEIGSLSPYWLTGVELTDVKVRKASATAVPIAGDDGMAQDDAMRIPEVRARIGILALLLGDRALSFDAELEEGAIEGVYEESGDTKHIDATLSQIDLAKLGVLDSVIPLPVKGDFGGELDLTLGKDAAKSTGSMTLKISGVTIGDGKAKLKVGAMGGLTIEPIEAGNVTIELDVKQGVGNVKKLSADGKDLELSGGGEVHFADPVARSRADILLRVKFTDAYKTKSSRTQVLFSLLDGAAVPQVRAAKTPDGALQFRLAGTLGALRANPSGRSAAPGSGRGASGRTRRIPTPSPIEGDDDDDDQN